MTFILGTQASSEESLKSDEQIINLEVDLENEKEATIETAWEVSNIQDKLIKLKLGRNRGSPRKLIKMKNFFHFALKSKKGQQSGKKKIKKLALEKNRKSNTPNLVDEILEGDTHPHNAPSLEEKILESSQLMRFLMHASREETLNTIRENIEALHQVIEFPEAEF